MRTPSKAFNKWGFEFLRICAWIWFSCLEVKVGMRGFTSMVCFVPYWYQSNIHTGHIKEYCLIYVYIHI